MRTRLAWIAVVASVSISVPAAADVARAEVPLAGRWPNPRVTVDRESVLGVSEVLTTVLQPLPLTGRRGLERAAAAAAAEATVHRTDEETRRLRRDVRAAYAALAAAQVRERELTAARDRLDSLVNVLAAREAAGDAAGFDRLRAAREVLDVDADLAAAAVERGRAQTRLAGLLDGTLDPGTLVVDDSAVVPVQLPPLDVLVDRAVRTRGEFLALRKDLDAAHLTKRAIERRRIPEPEVLAGTKSSSAGGGDIGSVLGVQAVIPLFDRGTSEKTVADARASQATARLEALRVTTSAEIAVSRRTALDRRQAAERYRTSSLTTTGEIERIAQVSYDAGERGILELLDAYRTTASARLRQAALDAAVREAEIELEFVSGWEIP
jgi:cobalt-zinc-cadmium efflux system outer membrane protein